MARIIIVQINHLSISEASEFTEEKIDKLMVFCGKHNQQPIGVYSERSILSVL